MLEVLGCIHTVNEYIETPNNNNGTWRRMTTTEHHSTCR
jgi:hypothetical protein